MEIQKIHWSGEKVITIISAYQVRNNNRSGITAYHQQQSTLIQGGTTSNRKPGKQLQNDLCGSILASQSNGESIILARDSVKILTSEHPAQLIFGKSKAWLTYLQYGTMTLRKAFRGTKRSIR